MRRLSLLLLLIGCVDDPELASEATEITAPGPSNITVLRGPCAEKDVSATRFARFRTALIEDLLPRARTVARSPAFKECVRTAVTTGGVMLGVNRWQYIPNGNVKSFGPYIPRRDQDVEDIGFHATDTLPVDRMRDLYADRLALEATSPHPVEITCKLDGGGNGRHPTVDRLGPEIMSLSKDFFNEDPAPGAVPGFRSFAAAVIWHELMHTRDYHHDNEAKNGQVEPQYNNRAPAIVGACMDEAFHQAEQVCGFKQCSRGFFPVAFTFRINDGGTCFCAPDPGAVFTPSLVGTWSLPGVTKLALDDGGRAFVLANGIAYRLDNTTWTQLMPAFDLVAGGDAVSIKHRSPLVVGPPFWWTTIPHVGAQTAIHSVAGETMTMDGFGRLVRLLNGQVERKEGAGPWVAHGPADSISAGADLTYRILNGFAWRLDDGPTPAWTEIGALGGAMTVDAYGTAYNLPSDQSLWRHRGTFWERIGGPNDQIDAGSSFFTHSPVDGFVYRRAPDNGWYRVAQCDSFAAGGRNVLCRRGTTLELYEY